MNANKPKIHFQELQSEPCYQDWGFIYVLRGVAPEFMFEFMPGVAYRRAGAAERFRRKVLKCPFCAFRLTDMDEEAVVELYGHEKRVAERCHFYIRCSRCHKEVGINIA